MLTLGAAATAIIYPQASQKLNKKAVAKIMENGLYHITSEENADKILRTGKLFPSRSRASYSTLGRKSCFFFAGKPRLSDLVYNITKINPELAIIKITPETLKQNPDFVKKLTHRKFDGAIMYKGTCKVPMEKSKLMFMLKDDGPELVEDKDGFGERVEEYSKSKNYLNKLSKQNPLSRLLIFAKFKAKEIDTLSIKRNFLKLNISNKKKEAEQYKIEDIITELEQNGKVDFYREEISNKNFKRDYFHTSPIHGVRHTERVCFHANALGHYEKLPEGELRILMDAAKYHDVGRVGKIIGDIFDFNHGTLSAKKIERENLVQYESKDDFEILKYIVANHSVDDKKAFPNIKKSKIQDTAKAERLLSLLKDADNLDRVRTLDMNPKYLRTESAKKMVEAASELFVRHKEIIHPKENENLKPKGLETSMNLDKHHDDSRNVAKVSGLINLAEKREKKIAIPRDKVDEVKKLLREQMKSRNINPVPSKTKEIPQEERV